MKQRKHGGKAGAFLVLFYLLWRCAFYLRAYLPFSLTLNFGGNSWEPLNLLLVMAAGVIVLRLLSGRTEPAGRYVWLALWCVIGVAVWGLVWAGLLWVTVWLNSLALAEWVYWSSTAVMYTLQTFAMGGIFALALRLARWPQGQRTAAGRTKARRAWLVLAAAGLATAFLCQRAMVRVGQPEIWLTRHYTNLYNVLTMVLPLAGVALAAFQQTEQS